MREPELLGLRWHPLNPEGVFLLRPFNGYLEASRQIGGATRVVNMSMGDEDLFDADAPLVDLGNQSIDVSTGIDNGAALACLIPEQRTVLSEGRHRDDSEFEFCHKISVTTQTAMMLIVMAQCYPIFAFCHEYDADMPETLIPHIDSPFAWSALLVFVTAALGADFMSLRRQGNRVIGFRDALRWSLLWVGLAMVFCAGLWLSLDLSDGRALANVKAGEFLTGYLIEKSLSVDNLFVFLMLFTTFHVPLPQQKKALMIGIIAAIVLRILLILIGAWLISRFSWVMYLFGVFLLYTGIKMVVADEEAHDLENNQLLKWMRNHLTISHEYHGSALYVMKDKVRVFTPLFLVVVLIGVTDVMFAVDSIPAIFAVTNDPYIVMSSNIFAVLGLRALYFMLAGMAERFHLLKFGLAAILAFIGTKMLIVDFYHIPVGVSLAIVLVLLVATMIASLVIKPKATG